MRRVTATSSTPTAAASSLSASPAASQHTSRLCQDVAALRASLEKLTSVKIAAGSAAEMKTSLTTMQANLTKLAGDAGTQYQLQISALKSARSNLQTAVTNLTSHHSASAVTGVVTGVVTALGGLTTAAHQLLTAVGTRCPSSSPSP